MQDNSTKYLLYIQTATSNHLETNCVFLHCDYILKVPINKLVSYYAKLHLSSQSVLIETAKNILNINKLVPIYINPKTILFPLKHKRATDTNLYQCTLYCWYDCHREFNINTFSRRHSARS